jgi:hypothetical protein
MELLLIIILFFYGVLVIYNYFTIYLHNISEESNSRNDGIDTIPEKNAFNPFFLLRHLK